MSEKARDNHGRWRSKTIAFRISPEENELLEDFVRLSGLTKQAYIIQRVLDRDVAIIPNPRVQKALKEKMEHVCTQLSDVQAVGDLSPEFFSVVEFMGKIYESLGANEKTEVKNGDNDLSKTNH